MRRTVFLLVAIPVLGLGFAAMASAVGDQYGPDYPEDTTSTSPGSTTGGPAQSAAGRFSYTATLNAQQEVAAPSGASSARGLFTAIAASQGAKTTLRWTLTFSGLTGRADAAHIHLGERGVAGDVLQPLCGPCRNGHTGTSVLSVEAAEALAKGDAYVNVHTATNAAGEIRGQATRGAIAYRVTITSAQEIPKPSGAGRAAGVFTGSLRATGARATLTWKLAFSNLTGTAVAAHIHVGKRGKAGSVVAALCGPCKNGARGSVTLTEAALAAIESGRAYVNVHTAKNQAGEVRGQLATGN